MSAAIRCISDCGHGGRTPWWVFGLLCALFSPGCSTQTLDRTPCDTNESCRVAFGLGSSCREDGYCDVVDVPSRCQKTYPSDLFDNSQAYADSFVFGSLFNRDSQTHGAREKSIELAVRQVNVEGGLDGQKFGVVFCDIAPGGDDGATTTAEAAVPAASYLVETLGTPVILGPASSEDVEQVFEAIRGSGTFVISPSATGPALTDIDETAPSDGKPGLLWRTAPPDDLQGQAIAEDMAQRDVARVQVIAEDDAYGQGLSEIFLANFGGEAELTLFDNANRLTEAITAVGNGDAEEVLFIASAQRDVVTFLRAAETIVGYEDKQIFLTDSAATADTLADTPVALFPQVRGTRPSQPDTTDNVFGNFAAAYQAQFREDVTRFSFTAQAYDMTWLAMLGVAWARTHEDEVTGRNIARGARRLSEGKSFALTPSQWSPMVEALQRGDSIDVRGASGGLDFDLETEELLAPIDIWTIDTSGTAPEIQVVDVFMTSASD